MSVDPYRLVSQNVDMSDRVRTSVVVAASPAAAAETIIASTAAMAPLRVGQIVLLDGWAAYTVGTNGTAVRFRIRQTDASGAVVADTGALTGSQHGAAILSADDVGGVDTAPSRVGQVYALTMQVTAGTAPSAVSAVRLVAFAI